MKVNVVFLILFFSGIFVFSRGFLSFQFGGVSNLLVLLGFPSLFLVSLMRWKINNIRITGVTTSILIFIILVVLLSLKSLNIIRIFVGVSGLVFYTSLYFSILSTIKNTEGLFESIDKLTMGFFIYLTLFAFIEMILNSPLSTFPQYPLPNSMRGVFPNHRMSSSIGSTLPFSVTYSYLTIYLFIKVLYKPIILNIILFVIGTLILLGAYNRGGIGMGIIGFVVAFFFKKKLTTGYLFNFKLNPKKLLFMMMFFIFFIWGLTYLPSTAIERVFAIFDWEGEKSNLKRVYFWKNAIESMNWVDVPFGISIGSTGNVLKLFNLKGLLNNDVLITESYYLKLLVETGIVGLFSFWFIIFTALKKSFNFKIIHESNNIEKMVKTFLFTCIFANSIQLFFLQSLESTSVAFLFYSVLAFIQIISSFDKQLYAFNTK